MITTYKWLDVRRLLVLSELSDIQKKTLRALLRRCESVTSYGFSGVHGHVGRSAILDIDGHWEDGVIAFFHVRSFGGLLNGKHVYTRGDAIAVNDTPK